MSTTMTSGLESGSWPRLNMFNVVMVFNKVDAGCGVYGLLAAAAAAPHTAFVEAEPERSGQPVSKRPTPQLVLTAQGYL